MNIGEAVKERILELCQERNISVNKLSNMSGVTQSTVNNIISGRNNSTTISTIKKLCNGLEISVEEFLFRIVQRSGTGNQITSIHTKRKYHKQVFPFLSSNISFTAAISQHPGHDM